MISIDHNAVFEQPLSSQLAQMLMIGSPNAGDTVVNDESTQIFAANDDDAATAATTTTTTPIRSDNFCLKYEAGSASLGAKCLESPPTLSRLRNYNISWQRQFDTVGGPHLSTAEDGSPWGQVDWGRKTLANSFEGSITDDEPHTPKSPSSSFVDPFNIIMSQSLVTPPSHDYSFFHRNTYRVHSQRGRATLRSPIQKVNSYHASSQQDNSSTLQNFPVSTRGGRGLRRSLISPLKIGRDSVITSSTGLLFPSPPNSPNNGDSQLIKRLRLVNG